MMPLSEIVACAAGLIEQNGWARGRTMDENGCLCAGGALRVAAGLAHNASKTAPSPISIAGCEKEYEQTISDFIRAVSGGETSSVAWWNDRPGQTQTTIVAALLGFCAELRAAGK